MADRRVFDSSLVVVCLLIAGCSGASRSEPAPPVLTALDTLERSQKNAQPPAVTDPVASTPAEGLGSLKLDDAPVTGTYQVKFETSAGDFTVEVRRDWAPVGAQRFYELVQSGFYNECRFFRVVPEFMVQFGINGDPGVQSRWKVNLRDDPRRQSNERGFITFATAGPNSRTTQVFINYKHNDFLDSQGFSPFGKVIDGMQNVDAIYSGYGERPDQGAITASGNAYLKGNFPKLDYISQATIISESE